MSDEYSWGYRNGYRNGFADGMQEGQKSVELPNAPDLSEKPRCRVCGITFDGPFGYVCTHNKCPSRISWGTLPITYTFGQATRFTSGTPWNDDESR